MCEESFCVQMLSYQRTDSMSKTQHVIWIADAKNRFKDYKLKLGRAYLRKNRPHQDGQHQRGRRSWLRRRWIYRSHWRWHPRFLQALRSLTEQFLLSDNLTYLITFTFYHSFQIFFFQASYRQLINALNWQSAVYSFKKLNNIYLW